MQKFRKMKGAPVFILGKKEYDEAGSLLKNEEGEGSGYIGIFPEYTHVGITKGFFCFWFLATM